MDIPVCVLTNVVFRGFSVMMLLRIIGSVCQNWRKACIPLLDKFVLEEFTYSDQHMAFEEFVGLAISKKRTVDRMVEKYGYQCGVDVLFSEFRFDREGAGTFETAGAIMFMRVYNACSKKQSLGRYIENMFTKMRQCVPHTCARCGVVVVGDYRFTTACDDKCYKCDQFVCGDCRKIPGRYCCVAICACVHAVLNSKDCFQCGIPTCAHCTGHKCERNYCETCFAANTARFRYEDKQTTACPACDDKYTCSVCGETPAKFQQRKGYMTLSRCSDNGLLICWKQNCMKGYYHGPRGDLLLRDAKPWSMRIQTAVDPRALCRDFTRIGWCKLGDRCDFRHDILEVRPVCKFFAGAGCKYESQCKFEHSRPSSPSPPSPPVLPKPSLPPACRHFARLGRCNYGDRCKFKH